MSEVFQLWVRNWAHVRATCGSGGLTKEICRAYGLELRRGDKNPSLSVSVVAPPDTASITILCERETSIAPWTIFHGNYGTTTAVHETAEWVDYPYQEDEDAPRERSPPKEEEGQKQHWSRGRSGYYRALPPGARGNVLRCGQGTLRICVVQVHNILKWDSPYRELRVMYKSCPALQVDIFCGDENQAWNFRYNAHKAERTHVTGKTHPEPLNCLVNAVANFKVSRLNQREPICIRVAMEYVDNNAYEINANPEAADYDMWDGCFIQLFPMANQINSTLCVCQSVLNPT